MLSKLINLKRTPQPFAPLEPAEPFTVVGDIHGRADLLTRFLKDAPDHQIICVGDYIDRGDHSADVLRTLQARRDVICLSGNHEELMLSFLDDPAVNGRRWLRSGGLQTLASFGIGSVTETSGSSALRTAAHQLRQAMGPDLLNWVRKLPTCWQSGNVAVVHAGADPAVPIKDQAREHLHWGHKDFASTRRQDDVWVIHGHTIVDTPTAQEGRISIDTGAYATGVLTAAHVDNAKLMFETL